MNTLSTVLYGFYTSIHPFDGFWELKYRREKGFSAALSIFIFSILVQIASVFLTHPLFNPLGMAIHKINILFIVFSIMAPVIVWSIITWSITTLFDGEATMKQVFISTCFALFPMPLLQILQIILSHVLTIKEAPFYYLLGTIITFWVGFLILTGMTVFQGYTMFKTIVVSICSIIGIIFFVFIVFVLYNTLQQLANFFVTVFTELYYWLMS